MAWRREGDKVYKLLGLFQYRELRVPPSITILLPDLSFHSNVA